MLRAARGGPAAQGLLPTQGAGHLAATSRCALFGQPYVGTSSADLDTVSSSRRMHKPARTASKEALLREAVSAELRLLQRCSLCAATCSCHPGQQLWARGGHAGRQRGGPEVPVLCHRRAGGEHTLLCKCLAVPVLLLLQKDLLVQACSVPCAPARLTCLQGLHSDCTPALTGNTAAAAAAVAAAWPAGVTMHCASHARSACVCQHVIECSVCCTSESRSHAGVSRQQPAGVRS